MQPNSINAVVYSQKNCQGCDAAKALLRQYEFNVEERMLGTGERWTKQDLLSHLPGVRSVPQIIIGDTHVGGLKELQEVLAKGVLDWNW